MTTNLLKQFIHPVTHKAFMADYWQQKIAISHGPLSRLPKPLSNKPLNDLNSLLSVYKGSINFSRGSKSPNALNAEALPPYELYRMGLTLYLGNVAPCIPESNKILQSFENDLGLPQGSARCGVFASPAGEGAPCHYDAEDVFSIQLTGTKTFEVAPMTQIINPVGMQYSPHQRLYSDLYPQIKSEPPAWKQATFKSIRMQPGSVLFIPRGTWHRSTAHDDSMSISIILNPPIILDAVLSQLRQLMLQSAEWRQPVSALTINDKNLSNLLAKAPELFASLNTDSINQSAMPPEQRLSLINANSRFIKNPDARLKLSKEGHNNLFDMEREAINGIYNRIGTLDLDSELVNIANHLIQQRTIFTAKELFTNFSHVEPKKILRFLQVLAQGQVLALLDFPKLK